MTPTMMTKEDFRGLGAPDLVYVREIRAADVLAYFDRPRTSNGPTEAINNLVKRVKRVAFGFRRFDHYRIRSLLYAGKPNWGLLPALTPP